MSSSRTTLDFLLYESVHADNFVSARDTLPAVLRAIAATRQ